MNWFALIAVASLRQAYAISSPPNIVVFLVDDLGWNQVGYHAKKVGNNEIVTPNIDQHAQSGIELDRGYMTPWCGPSRAALMTGRTNVFNGNVTTTISSFDDDIGFVAGLPPGTKTIATAFKEYGNSIGKPYKAYFNGKWGIGGTAYTNTPLGMGFDEFRGFWGTGLEVCDGVIPFAQVIDSHFALPLEKDFGPQLLNTLPGYFEQSLDIEDNNLCPYFQSLSDDFLTQEEKIIACKTRPRVPEKHIDLEHLDKVKEQISSHNFAEGPFLQIFSTAMMHQPIAYPKEYDVRNAATLPEYFQPGKVKPVAGPEDIRLGLNSALRFVDDLFGETIKAIKDAGQWDNTIVYFTTDNGGPVYTAAAANNYPLRGAKFHKFEGGTRVVQFMTGGWLDKNLPSSREYKSNSYIFPHDIAPTLLDMAGADVNFLLGGLKGAVYGNSLWNYIKNSVNPAQTGPSQLVRKVSYGKDFFFDVQADKTFKNFYTGDTPQYLPMLWEPVWPKADSLVIDTNYKSIRPCRPGNIPLRCCLLDIENDFQELNPLPADCDAMSLEAKNLFEIEGGCAKDANGKYLNNLCISNGMVGRGALPQRYSLWTQMGAAGPFTNSKGQPLDGLPMKCVCESVSDWNTEDEINSFTLKIFSPGECSKKKYLGKNFGAVVPCDGTFAKPPLGKTSELFDEFKNQGVNITALKHVSWIEDKQLILLGVPGMLETLVSYMSRQGFSEWPDTVKFPYIVDGANSCPEKGVTSLPYPLIHFAPYIYGGDIRATVPEASDQTIVDTVRNVLGLCALYADNKFFCPSRQNWDFKPVVRWDYNRFRPRGYFSDGSVWEPYGLIECMLYCQKSPKNTPYIGNGPHGLVH